MKVKSIVDVENGYELNELLWGEAHFVMGNINQKYLGNSLLEELEIIFGEEPNIADINEYLSSEFDEWDFYARHMFIADLNLNLVWIMNMTFNVVMRPDVLAIHFITS